MGRMVQKISAKENSALSHPTLKTLIHNAVIVNEGQRFRGAVLIEEDRIADVIRDEDRIIPHLSSDARCVDADGALLLPGIIDTHVHFREPGMTHKADIAHESRAALAGGVTSVMDMPNVNPPTLSLERWHERMDLGKRESRNNYAYYIAPAQPLQEEDILSLAKGKEIGVPALKVFMGSSTGNMLIDNRETLLHIFRTAAEYDIPIVTHCEDTPRINQRMAEARQRWGDDPDVIHHSWVRDAEACYRSSALAVELAKETGARLHIAHITTERELEFLAKESRITAEVCIPHLLFCDEDYPQLGTRLKCNPAVKTRSDRDALRCALADGRLLTVATDHAPHLLSEKEGGCARAASGIPMVQFSLIAMLGLVDEGVLTAERMVDAMCHQPARLFHIPDRGFLRRGYKADIVLVKPENWTLTKSEILSKCGWSPFEGHTFSWRVQQTYLNGHLAYDHGRIDDTLRGEALFIRNLTTCNQ